MKRRKKGSIPAEISCIVGLGIGIGMKIRQKLLRTYHTQMATADELQGLEEEDSEQWFGHDEQAWLS